MGAVQRPVFRSPIFSPLREALALCKVHFRYAIFFSALINVAYLAPTLYMLSVYDMVVPSSSDMTLMFVTVLLCLTLWLLTFLDRIRGRILASASIQIDNIFAPRLFKRTMNGGGNVLQRFREFETVRGALTGPLMVALFDAPWIPIYVGVCFYLHVVIGLVALGGSLLLLLLAIWNEYWTRPYAGQASNAQAIASFAQTSAGEAPDVVRALGMSAAFAAQFEAARARSNLPQMQLIFAQGRVGGLIRFVRLLLQSLALGVGAWLAIHHQISAGAIFASSMLTSRALAPIDQLVAQWRSASLALVAYRSLEAQLVREEAPELTNLPPPVPELSVERVSVAASTRDRLILRDVTFTARGGQIVAFIGPSGAGKTTLLQVLANARRADQGEVRIHDARYQDWSPERLGRHIGYLPQDCALFPGTIRDNISRFDALLRRDPAEIDTATVSAAKEAGVHDLILNLPDGYETLLGQRGRGLSAGQEQRISLARALYGSPAVYVMDEPDSALDAEGEAALIACVRRLRDSGALVLLAAHRQNLVGLADMIGVIKGGRLDRFAPRPAPPSRPAEAGGALPPPSVGVN